MKYQRHDLKQEQRNEGSLHLYVFLQVEDCVKSLCEVLGLSSVCDLYRRHMADLLQWLCDSQRCWTTHSVHKNLLHIVALQSGECKRQRNEHDSTVKLLRSDPHPQGSEM